MKVLKDRLGTICVDERWPRILWFESPDGKTRIPGEREAVPPRLCIYRKSDKAQLTSDDDAVRASYTLDSLSGAEAVYRATVECEDSPAAEFDIAIRLGGAEATIRFENVREFEGYNLLTVRFQRVVAASSRDGDGRVLTCHTQGRILDPAKCKPNMTDYSWHGALARQCGAAYRKQFMVTFDIPGYSDLFIQEVRQYSRVGFSETLASLGAEMMYRQRTVEGKGMPPPKLADTPAVERLDEPLLCTGPREIRLHFIAPGGRKPLDWTDAAKYFQTVFAAGKKCEPLYDNTLVYKIAQAQRNKPLHSVEESLDIIRRVHNLTDGMKQVCYFAGFQHFGHDTGHPDYFTVYPAIGDKASIRKAVKESRERYNTEVSFHLNIDVFSESSPLIEGRYITRDSLGRPSGQGQWGDNQLYGICIPAYRRQLAAIIARVVREYGIQKTVHLDTFNGAPFTYDASPRHPFSAYDLTCAKIDFVKEFHKCGLDVTSECLMEPYVGHVGHTWALFNYGNIFGEGEYPVPLANFIYHGATSWNAGHGHIPLTYFADKPTPSDSILGMLLQGGAAGIEFPEVANGMVDLADQLYLIQPPYMALRNRKWTGYSHVGSVHRVDYEGKDTFVEVDGEKMKYRVLVDGKVMAQDFQTVFPGPQRGTYLAYSRTDWDMDWPAPAGWKDGEISAVTLTESGPGIRVPAKVRKGRLSLSLKAHHPVRLRKLNG